MNSIRSGIVAAAIQPRARAVPRRFSRAQAGEPPAAGTVRASRAL